MADENPTEIPQTEEEEQPAPEVEQSSEENDVEYIEDPIENEEEMRKMFVGGITTDSTDDALKEFFEKMSGGEVTDNVIIRKDESKKSHFGFITFKTSQLIDEVLLKRDQLTFNNRLLDVNRAVPKNNTSAGAHEKTKKLFIANLPRFNCNDTDLRTYFEARHPKKYGTIESIHLIKKKDDEGGNLEENKGFGFITVSSEDMADKMAIQHATFEFGGRKIELKKSVPTGEGGDRGGRRGRGRGGAQAPYGGGYGGGGGGSYGGAQPYGGGYGGYGDAWGGYAYGPYDYSGYGYPGGYGAPPAGRGGRGGGRYKPY